MVNVGKNGINRISGEVLQILFQKYGLAKRSLN